MPGRPRFDAPDAGQMRVSGGAGTPRGACRMLESGGAGSASVPTTSGGTAIPVSALANLGYAMFVNMDPTNYVQLLSAASGTVLIKLLPGDVALFRFDGGITAAALLAHTAACNVQFVILEN